MGPSGSSFGPAMSLIQSGNRTERMTCSCDADSFVCAECLTRREASGAEPRARLQDEPTPSGARRSFLHPLPGWAAWVALQAAVGLSVLAGSAEDPLGVLVLVAGGAAAILLAGLALFRFHHFVLALLVLRASLDIAKTGPGTDVLAPTSLLSLAFMAAAVLWLLARRLRFGPAPSSPLRLAIVAFLGASLLSAIGSPRPLTSLVDFSKLASWGLMFLVLDQLLESRRDILRLLGAVGLSCTLPLVFGFVGAASGEVGPLMELKGELLRVSSTFDQSNSFARYLMLLLLVGWGVQAFLPRAPRRMVLVGSIPATILLVLTYTRTAWLGFALGLVLIGVLQSRKLLLGLLIGTTIVLLAVPQVSHRIGEVFTAPSASEVGNDSLSWRLSYWREVLPLVRENPITGIGLGGTAFRTETAAAPHNDYLRFLVEAGITGVAAYLGFLVALVATAVQAVRGRPGGLMRGLGVGFAACVLAYLFTSAGANVVPDIAVMWYLVAFAAAVTSAIRLESAASRSGAVEVPAVTAAS